MLDSGSFCVTGRGPKGGGGGALKGGGGAEAESTGWAAPHCRQYGCVGPTCVPHWLQKGIYLSIRQARAICSGEHISLARIQAMLTFSPCGRYAPPACC